MCAAPGIMVVLVERGVGDSSGGGGGGGGGGSGSGESGATGKAGQCQAVAGESGHWASQTCNKRCMRYRNEKPRTVHRACIESCTHGVDQGITRGCSGDADSGQCALDGAATCAAFCGSKKYKSPAAVASRCKESCAEIIPDACAHATSWLAHH